MITVKRKFFPFRNRGVAYNADFFGTKKPCLRNGRRKTPSSGNTVSFYTFFLLLSSIAANAGFVIPEKSLFSVKTNVKISLPKALPSDRQAFFRLVRVLKQLIRVAERPASFSESLTKVFLAKTVFTVKRLFLPRKPLFQPKGLFLP